MDKKDEAFLKKLLATFRVEAEEHIMEMASGLIDLEKDPEGARKAEIIETVFREAHSLKGAARAVNISEIEAVCQAVESVFAAMKRSEIMASAALFDLLQRAVDTLARFLKSLETAKSPAEKTIVKELVRQLEREARGASVSVEKKPNLMQDEAMPEQRQATPSPPTTAAVQGETIRIAAATLDAILLEAEELLPAKLFLSQRVAELGELNSLLSSWKKGWTRVIPEVRKMRRTAGKDGGPGDSFPKGSHLQKVAEFIEGNEDLMSVLSGRLAALEKALRNDQRSLGLLTDTLLTNIKKALLLPFSSLLDIFPKLVRDLSHAQGKDTELTIRGGEIKMDRRILEEFKDPLIHLVRNSIDHGIENREERVRKDKPTRGALVIEAVQIEGGKVEITVRDDGRGIDGEGVRAAAVKAGLVAPATAEKMDAGDAIKLAYLSGVSTSPIITDLSGRGLGLAIVREKVEKLGGIISIEAVAEKGTTFRTILPVTLATFRGIIVRMGENLFVLPTTNVERVLRLKPDEIRPLENRETIEIEGRAISLVRPSDILGIPEGKKSTAAVLPVAVLKAGETQIAFAVDEIMNEQEVLMKDLGPQLMRLRNIAGAAVLGSGKVVPVLNVADLLKSAMENRTVTPIMPVETGDEERKSILVVEDSITARTLLKNILETAGYAVKTAVDGLEALTLLKTEDFALTVSDVDMPKMNGFELTMKIRADRKLAEMPVILVTALDSREDRERGIDAGADAYIVKSSFDQSNLLEVIRRLI